MTFLRCTIWLLCFCLMGQAIAQRNLPITSYKYQQVQRLIGQIATTFGNTRPSLRLIMPVGQQSAQIAKFSPLPTPELIFDEKLYDLCRQFGPDSTTAMAIIIGHELTHYYNRHTEWMGLAQLASKQRIVSIASNQTLANEIQADGQGLYQAYVAGYKPFSIAAPLYQAIYQTYKLPDQLEGYPSKKERIELLHIQVARAHKLAFTFDVGLFFLLKKEYTRAEACFSYIAMEIPAPEILNNLGLTQIGQAVSLMTTAELPFRYPFIMDGHNRLRKDDVRGDAYELKEELLRKAADNFNRAWAIAPQYETAAINLASTFAIQGKNGTALETLSELEHILGKQKRTVSPNTHLLTGIIHTKLGQYSLAKYEFGQTANAFEIEYNKALFDWYVQSFRKDDPQASEKLIKWIDSYPKEKNNNSSPNFTETKAGSMSIPFPSQLTYTESFNLPLPDVIRARAGQLENLYYFSLHCSDRQYQVIQVPNSNKYVTLQTSLKIGSPQTDLCSQLGQPERIIGLSEGATYYCYDSRNLFIRLRNNLIESWLLFGNN